MDLIETGEARRRVLTPAAVAVALALVGAGQAAAVVRTPGLPDDVRLAVPKEAFGFNGGRGELTVTFQLRNDGDDVRVLSVGEPIPGLEQVDVVASGSPLGFREQGGGPEPLPAFDLPRDGVALVSLTYRLRSCGDVPRDARPVPVEVESGRARGVRRVALPELPDDAEAAADSDLVEWQRALVRDLCG